LINPSLRVLRSTIGLQNYQQLMSLIASELVFAYASLLQQKGSECSKLSDISLLIF